MPPDAALSRIAFGRRFEPRRCGRYAVPRFDDRVRDVFFQPSLHHAKLETAQGLDFKTARGRLYVEVKIPHG